MSEAGAVCPQCRLGKLMVYRSKNIGLLRRRYLRCSDPNCTCRGIEVVRLNVATGKPLLAKDLRTSTGT